MNPSSESLRAEGEALEAYHLFNMTGKQMPSSGGTDDQEAEWVEQINCITAAYNEVENIERKKESDRIKQQQMEAKMRGKGG